MKLTRDDFLAALTGAGQGAAMDFGDELYGAGRGAIDALAEDAPLSDAYTKRRDEARDFVRAIEEKSPIAYGIGDIAGSFAPIPGAQLGMARAAAPLLERVGKAAIMGGLSGTGRSEGKNLKDVAIDALSSGAQSAGTAFGMDQMMRRIGDVIDFKKMRDKLKAGKAEKIAAGIEDDLPPIPREGLGARTTSDLGRPSKESMSERNKRVMEEMDRKNRMDELFPAPSRSHQFPDEEIRPRASKGNVTSIRGEPRDLEPKGKQRKGSNAPLTPAPESPPELDPSDIWGRINARFLDDDKSGMELKRLMKNVESKGADEPYVGRDFHSVAALENPKNQKYPQPLPVPVDKIGDLKGVLGKGVLKGDSDPFGWIDNKYGVGKGLLERERDKKLKIYTRSDLIAHDDYIEHINPKLHEVNIVIATPNDQISRMAEPGAPSVKRRITAANRLAEQGIKVNFIYQTYDNKNLSEKFKQLSQPPILNTIRALRDSGLAPGIKVIEERTPIADRNAKNLMKIFGED